CASQHGDPLLRPDAVAALTGKLLQLADPVKPKLGEGRGLTGRDVIDVARVRDAAKALHDLGPRWVLVKGGHLRGDVAVDVLYDGADFVELEEQRRATEHTHGTGDTLAAAVAASLTRGADMVTAVNRGKRFVTEAIDDSFALGAGLGPVGHFWRVREQS